MNKSAAKKAKKKTKLRGLMNWPPSRGPMPASMRRKPKYLIPELKIELVKWVIDSTKKPYTRGWKEPAKLIKRIVTKPFVQSKKNKALSKKGIHSVEDMRAHHDAQPALNLSLNQDVATMAGLSDPEQWELISGAELCPAKTIPAVRRGAKNRRFKARATSTSSLPTRAITVDIDYPLENICRVTIQPYTVVSSYGTKYKTMNIGYVLFCLAKAYKDVYKNWKAYGIWGHAITDLTFDGFDLSDNIGAISISS